MPTRWGSFALLCLLGTASSALAQRPDDVLRTGSQRSVYAVSGVALGATVQSESSAYREYKCGPSDQFDGFTWCQKTRGEGAARLFQCDHTQSCTRLMEAAVYVNRYQEPAFFGANEADEDIQRYSRKIGEQPRIITDAAPTRASEWHTRVMGQG